MTTSLKEHGAELRELFEIVRSMLGDINQPGAEGALLIAVLIQIQLALGDSAAMLCDIADSLDSTAASRPPGATLH